MPVNSDATLTRFFNAAEQQVSQETNFLVDRLSLNITAQQAIYTLPDYVRDIRRITWLGLRMDPLTNRSYRDFFGPGNQEGTPFWYLYSNIQQNSIQFFPVPPGNVPSVTNVWDTDIPNGVIVEFNRISDNSTFVMPQWARNQVCKRYVSLKTYTMEGPGQNLKIAKYYEEQWPFWKARFKSRIDELYGVSAKRMITGIAQNNWYPGTPILPIDQFGIYVDTGS